MQKIIFLDIDGVLNCENAYTSAPRMKNINKIESAIESLRLFGIEESIQCATEFLTQKGLIVIYFGGLQQDHYDMHAIGMVCGSKVGCLSEHSINHNLNVLMRNI